MLNIHPFLRQSAFWQAMFAAIFATGLIAIGDEPPTTQAPPQTAPAVYIDDSLKAKELFIKAKLHAHHQRWDTASKILCEAIENHGDHLLKTAPGHFTTVTQQVHNLVRSWPPNGRQAYSDHNDSSAQRERKRISTSIDLATVLRSLNQFRYTSADYELGMRAVELAMERGQFVLARSVCDAILENPAIDETQRVHASSYRTVAIEGIGSRVHQSLPIDVPADATIHWMGRSRNLRDVIAEIDGAFNGKTETQSPHHWPTLSGNSARNANAVFEPSPLSPLWRFVEFGDGSPTMKAMNERSYGYHRKPDHRRLMAMNPVWAKGVIFAQDAIRVWAIQSETGRLLWSHVQSESAEGAESTFDSSVASWYCPTYQSNRVYACMGGNIVPYYGYEQSGPSAAIVCLDVATGKLLWQHKPTVSRDANIEIEFDGAPIVEAGLVLAIERRRRSFGFEDCVLLALDALSGEVKYRTHLAAASTGGFGYRRATTTIAAARDATVYVCTNLGAFAAVNTFTGRVQWLRTYTRRSASNDSHDDEQFPFAFNPIIIDRDRLIFLPSDAEQVLVASNDDGRIIHEIDTTALHNVKTLCGVQQDRIVGVGDAAFAYDMKEKKLDWAAEMPEPLFGRSLLTRRLLLTPTPHALYVFDLDNGDRTEYPLHEADTGGNLLAADDQIIIASADHISAYADSVKVVDQLQQRMLSEPQNADAALDVAEILFQVNKYSAAIEAIAEAIKRAGANSALNDLAKKRIFDDCLSFEQRLAQSAAPQNEIRDHRHALLELASHCPPNRAGQLAYRLRWATLHEQDGAPDRAIHLYQQILSDASLRLHLVATDESTASPTAATYCTKRIDQIIASHGRAAYAQQESEAASRLDDVRQSGDISAIENVAATFPNALAARDALLLAGDRFKSSGDHIRAIRCYYHALYAFKFDPSNNSNSCIAHMIANSYLQLGNMDARLRWRQIAKRNSPDCEKSDRPPDTTVADNQKRHYAKWSAIPSQPFERKFQRRCALLQPKPLDQNQPDTFFVYTDAALTAYDAATDQPKWNKPSPCRMQPRIVSQTQTRTVFATRHLVFALDRDTGQRLWSFGRYPSDLADPLFDHENFSVFRYHATAGGVLFSFQDNSQWQSTNIETGKPIALSTLDFQPTGNPIALTDRIAFPIHQNDMERVCIVEAASGETQAAVDIEGGMAISQLGTTDDQQIIAATLAGLHAIDATTGEIRWRFIPHQPVIAASLRVATDGIYIATQNKIVRKLRLSDGEEIWQSQPLAMHVDGAIRLQPQSGTLLVLGEGFAAALDDQSGALQFIPENADRISPGLCLTTDQYLIALELGDAAYDEPARVRITDLKNGASVSCGAMESFDPIKNFGGAVTLDDALVILDGSRILGWRVPQ